MSIRMSYSLAFSQSVFMMLFVASKVEQGLYDFTPTQKISQDLNIPPSTASMILRRLNRAGLIETREGANGGVRLALPPEEITILDLFTAIEQQRTMFPTDMQMGQSSEKVIKVKRTVHQLLETAEGSMKQSLQSVTIRDLMDSLK